MTPPRQTKKKYNIIPKNMPVIFGVVRNKCEHKDCNYRSRYIYTTGITSGCNTFARCTKHRFKDLDEDMMENKI